MIAKPETSGFQDCELTGFERPCFAVISRRTTNELYATPDRGIHGIICTLFHKGKPIVNETDFAFGSGCILSVPS